MNDLSPMATTLKVEQAFINGKWVSADDGATSGPLINVAAVEKVERYIADARDKGASVVCGGRRHERGGTFFQPTVIADANGMMLLAQDETFGRWRRFSASGRKNGGGGDPPCQRHQLWPRGLYFHPRHRSHVTRDGRHRDRDGWIQWRPDLQ